jgi:hypothetical protein
VGRAIHAVSDAPCLDACQATATARLLPRGTRCCGAGQEFAEWAARHPRGAPAIGTASALLKALEQEGGSLFSRRRSPSDSNAHFLRLDVAELVERHGERALAAALAVPAVAASEGASGSQAVGGGSEAAFVWPPPPPSLPTPPLVAVAVAAAVAPPPATAQPAAAPKTLGLAATQKFELRIGADGVPAYSAFEDGAGGGSGAAEGGGETAASSSSATGGSEAAAASAGAAVTDEGVMDLLPLLPPL